MRYKTVQLSCSLNVQLFVTPWTAARQASLSITNSRNLLKLISIETVIPSNNLILCCPLLLLPSIFPSIKVFPVSYFFPSGGHSIGVSASASVLPVNIQHWFPLGWTGWISLQPKGLSRVFSTPQFKSINSSVLSFLYSPSLYMTTGKTIALTRQTIVGKVMSLLFNMLSRLAITFLPRSRCLLISWLWSPSAVILELRKIKSVTVSPCICHEVMGPDAMILVFWMLHFKPTFSLSSFAFIEHLKLYNWCHSLLLGWVPMSEILPWSFSMLNTNLSVLPHSECSK